MCRYQIRFSITTSGRYFDVISCDRYRSYKYRRLHTQRCILSITYLSSLPWSFFDISCSESRLLFNLIIFVLFAYVLNIIFVGKCVVIKITACVTCVEISSWPYYIVRPINYIFRQCFKWYIFATIFFCRCFLSALLTFFTVPRLKIWV